MNLEIDRHRLISEIETLAAISDADPPAVTRIVFTPTDLKARAWLAHAAKKPASRAAGCNWKYLCALEWIGSGGPGGWYRLTHRCDS